MRTSHFVLLLVCALVLSACGGDQPPQEFEDETLVYAALNPVSRELQQSIARFNEKHTDVQIEIQDYSDEGGVDRLRIELMLGQVPDIMEMHYFGKTGPHLWTEEHTKIITPGTNIDVPGEYWMPYQQMAQRGYLEDLWPYIEDDPQLGRDGVLQAPMKAAEVDGGLYILFRSVSIFTLMGPESVIGDRDSWTMEELMEAFSTMPADSTILRYNMTKRDVFFDFLRFSLSKYVNMNTGTSSFDSEDFREMLMFLRQFPEETGLEETEYMMAEVRDRIWDKMQMLECMMIVWPTDVGYADAIWQERAAFPGYPTADGGSGNFFYPMRNILSMSSACRNKDAAWDFIRTLIIPRSGTAEPLLYIRDMPVNQHDYELLIYGELRQMEKACRVFPKDWNTICYSRSHFDYGPKITLMDLMTDEDMQRYRDLTNNTTRLYWPNDDLTDIVWDSIGPYLAGDRNMDDTIALLQNRAQLYVNEQR